MAASNKVKQLKRIVDDVRVARNLKDALLQLVGHISEMMGVSCAAIYLCDINNQGYRLVAAEGFPEATIGHLLIPFGKGLVGFVAEECETINIVDPSSHDYFFYIKETKEERFKVFFGTPIIHQRKVIGVLVLQNEAPKKFDETEVTLAMTLCVLLAPLIAHAEMTGDLPSWFRTAKKSDANYVGIPGSQGIAMGQAVVVAPLINLDNVPDKISKTPIKEIQAFREALKLAREEIRHLGQQLKERLPPEETLLFDAYAQMLDGENLGQEVESYIRTGLSAKTALKEVIRQHVRIFENMDDGYLRERAADIKDMGCRVFAHLSSYQKGDIKFPERFILIGEELTASMLAEVPMERLAGIISARGSRNSHVAILARALGIPAVVGVHGLKFNIDGEFVIVDGYAGEVYLSPSLPLKKQFQKRIEEEKEFNQTLSELRDLWSETPDGKRIPLCVNTGLVADIKPSLEVGAEGVGLYRTEVPFMIRDRFPGEEEQYQTYRELLSCFAPKPVTIRTLDIGGDKSLPYMPIKEENPFLGWRGIRVTLDHPEIFLLQLRAMLRANIGLNNLKIMLPMVTQVQEIREAKRLIKVAQKRLMEQGLNVSLPPLGVMIEVPAAVYQIDDIAKEIDFISVGSNDLVQYLLAVDRNNARVADLYDPLHPAVLTALGKIVEGGHKYNLVVGICGEMAADPCAAILLMGLGFDLLSMNATSLPRIKWIIRNFTIHKAQEILSVVKEMTSPQAVREYVRKKLEEAGMQVLLQ